MILDLNPIILDYEEQSQINNKFRRWRQIFEDPAHQLDIDENLRIRGDDKAYMYQIKEMICKGLKDEEDAINKEVQSMKDCNVTQKQIEDESLQMGGISYTSILVYLNEDKEEIKSHEHYPGRSICKYITEQMAMQQGEGWRNFP